MSTTFHSTIQQSYMESNRKESILTKFMTWCKEQEEQRILWIGLALTVHGCFFAPLTILLIGISGFNFSLIMIALGAMAGALIVNLAALPTKITIPVFILSLLADIAVIGFTTL